MPSDTLDLGFWKKKNSDSGLFGQSFKFSHDSEMKDAQKGINDGTFRHGSLYSNFKLLNQRLKQFSFK